MLSLNLPVFDAKVVNREGKPAIFDVIRRRYVALTPEEWVRQHFVHFLLNHKGYPQTLMANEVQVQLNGTKKRCDTVLYRRDLTARMIVEYKAPDIEITQAVFDQITRYNMVLKVDYLVVSNGMQHYCCRMDYERNSYTFLPDILMILAECHYHLGNHDKSAERYRQAYYLYKAIEDESNLAILRVEAKDFLGLELD